MRKTEKCRVSDLEGLMLGAFLGSKLGRLLERLLCGIARISKLHSLRPWHDCVETEGAFLLDMIPAD